MNLFSSVDDDMLGKRVLREVLTLPRRMSPLIYVLLSLFAPLTEAGIINRGLLESRANQDADLRLSEVPRNLTSASDTVTIRWQPEVRGMLRFSFRYQGEEPEGYDNRLENPIRSGAGFLMFLGGALPVGYLFCIIEGEGGDYSTVFNIIREADQAPQMVSPISARGEAGINTVTPIFRWQTVSGVPFYHIIVSDQPFRIIRNPETGETRVEGANVIWQAITSQTSIQYGVPDPSEFFDNALVPPLVGSRDRNRRPRYAWVVLNNYGNHPGYTSIVTGGVSGFEVEVDPPFEPPRNISPQAGARLSGREITFRWSQVGEAASYFVYVSREEVSAGGSRGFVPAWTAQTTLTSITCPAGEILSPGRYIWKVLAANRQARGTVSDTTSFTYSLPSGEVSVYTRTREDEPLQFVEIEVEPVEGPAVPRFSTNDEGVFTRVFPVGTFRLHCRKEGYEEAVSQEFTVEDGEQYQVVVRLTPIPSSVVGVVRSRQDSSAIPYARINAREARGGSEVWAEADGSGQFQIILEPGSYQITAQARGFQISDERGVQVGAGQTIDLSERFGPFYLTPYQFTVSGYVHNTLGQPINSATVIATGEGGVVLRATTPESGTYSFRVGLGRWRLSAVKPGFYLESGDVTINITDSDQEVDFTLVPQAGIVSGQVLMGGVPAQRVGEVWLIPSAGDVVVAPVGENGTFNRGVPPGDWTIRPVRTGWTALDTLHLSVGPGETISGLRLRMVANPSSIEGRVVDEGGSPLRGAQVSASGVAATTDAQGQFRLQVPAGSHLVTASLEGYITARRGPLEVEAGANLQGVNLTLVGNASSITGAVRRGNDPVFDATVIATRGDDGGQFTTTTDRQGLFALNLRAGTYRLTARKSGLIPSPPGVWEITLQPGQRLENRVIPMVSWSSRIVGRVTTPAGALPAPNIEIIDLSNPQRSLRTNGNVEGFFQVSVEPERRYIVVSSKDGFTTERETTATLRPEEEVMLNVQLQPLPARISGLIQSGDRVLGGARVEARGEGRTFSTESQDNGRYQLSLPAGQFLITATKPGYLSAEVNLNIAAGQERSGVNLNLRENFARIAGRVTDTEQNPVGGAEITIIDSVSGRSYITRSDNDGYFNFERVLAGSFRLHALHPRYRREIVSLGVVVGGQERRGVEIRLQPLQAVVRGRVIDQDDNPVSGATIFAREEEGEEFSTSSAQDGSYLFAYLPSGTFSFLSTRVGYTGILQEGIQLRPADTLTVALRMVRHSGVIRGRVVSGDNQGLQGASVSVGDTLGHYGSATTDVSGGFIVENLYPYSRYYLTARKEGYSPVTDTLRQISPGAVVTYSMRANTLQISGRVVNQVGDPLAQTDLSLVSLADGQTFRAQSDASGRFRFAGLAPQTSYQLRTHRIEEAYVNRDTTVTLSDRDLDLGSGVIVVERAAAIRGRVNQPDVALTVRNLRTGRITTGYSSEDGSFRLLRLRGGDPGNFVLWAQKPGYLVRPDSLVIRNVGLREEREVRGEGEWAFILDQVRLTVSGIVQDTSGLPKAGVPLLLWSPVVQFTDTTDQDGTFRLEGVYPNLTYHLSTQLPVQGFDNGTVQFTLADQDTQNILLRINRHNAHIEGRVGDDAERPLSGVIVLLDGYRSTTTDDLGRFRFEYVGGGDHRLILSKSGYRRREVSINTEIGDREEPYRGEWQLTRLERAVYGVLRDARGENVSLPYGWAFLINSAGDTLLDTIGADAHFYFSDLNPDDTYHLIVKKKGWGTFEREGIRVGESSQEINPAIRPLSNTIFGRFVSENGEGIPNGVVWLRSFDHRDWVDTTDRFGQFAFTVEEGTFAIGGRDPQDTTRGSYRENVALTRGSWVELLLTSRMPGRLIGVVEDDEGNRVNIPGIINLYHTQRGDQLAVRSDQEGGFYLWGLAPGEWRLTATLPGYAMATPPLIIQVNAGGEHRVVVVVTRSGKAVWGYVYDQDSRPLSGVRVNLRGPRAAELFTDAEGFWTLPSPPAGTYTLSYFRHGFFTPSDTIIELPPGALLRIDRTLALKPNTISGWVRQSGGIPFPDALIELYTSPEGRLIDSVRTDRYGGYEFTGLEPGSYRLVPEVPDFSFSPQYRMVSLSAGQGIIDQDFTLTRVVGPAWINGWVRHQGDPVSTASIFLRNLSTGERFITLSDPQGHFEFTSIPAPGMFRLRAFMENLAEVVSDTFRVEIGDTIERSLTFPSGQIRVELYGAEGQPVVGRQVAVLDKSQNFRFVLFTDGSGRAETPNWLAPGEWSVSPQPLVGFLPPVPQSITLAENEMRTAIWHLGWQWESVNELPVGDSARVSVQVPVGVEVAEGFLYWRGVGAVEYMRKPLLRGGGAAAGERPRKPREVSYDPQVRGFNSGEVLYEYLPPQHRSGVLSYYLDIVTDDGLRFGGPQTAVSISVVTAGVLDRLYASRTPSALSPRLGVAVRLAVDPRDGRNRSLEGIIRDRGRVEWVSLRPGKGLILPDTTNPLRAIYIPRELGEERVKVTVYQNLPDGSEIFITDSTSLGWTNTNPQLKELKITAPSSVKAGGRVEFQVTATDTSGGLIPIAPRWRVEPTPLADFLPIEFAMKGIVITRAHHIGWLQVEVMDTISGLRAIFNADAPDRSRRGLEIYGEIVGMAQDTSAFTDGEGFWIKVPGSSYSSGVISRVGLSRSEIPPVMRLTPHYQSAPQGYRLSFSLPPRQGSQMVLRIPLPPAFTTNEISVGRWSDHLVEWEIFSPRLVERDSGFVEVVLAASSGLYAVIAQSPPLSIENLSFNPNPFSPSRSGGVWFEFDLTSDVSEAPTLTLIIYNMAGEKVRTVHQGPFPKGSYRRGQAGTLMWDGTTDWGSDARSGRYVVVITTEDTKRKIVKRGVLVLIR